MKKEELLKRIQIVPRWQGKFEIREDGITLRTFADVENLIDLFTERYTKSLIIDD
ncbi:Kiwa anti-phage protein KwaB-like domain-containing protein [Blautia luti]|uniref:Kiwa anti-phage protein KwaB-like domain-containing protein n=1 Tax=Blautia TaxID=572511 RepID=UPI003B50A4EB